MGLLLVNEVIMTTLLLLAVVHLIFSTKLLDFPKRIN